MTELIVPGVYRKGESGFIAPGSELHNALLSPSKIAAILSVSRWESAYRLFHRMKGITPQEPDRDDFRAGHALEGALDWFFREENPGWRLSRGEVQYVGDASRFGFPYVATLDRLSSRGRWQHGVEFKSCRGWDEWGSEDDECPWDYLVQVIAQMLLSGLTDRPAKLMVLNKIGCVHRTYTIEFNAAVADMIIAECQQFWASLQSDVPPPLDDSVATYECVREQHPDIDPGVEVEIPVELAIEYHEAWGADEAATKRLRFAKTQVLDTIGRANFAVAAGERVARRQSAARGAISLNRIKPGTKAAQTNEGEPAA